MEVEGSVGSHKSWDFSREAGRARVIAYGLAVEPDARAGVRGAQGEAFRLWG